ncbi:transcription regulator [Vibrio maritimus]|uniref:Transcription regulator n=1 Tax=Vibrio maritimus TaxID=990268 RepID=A0A090T578_9VIBR|nr:transcription regulator [Vibrio maritimus]
MAGGGQPLSPNAMLNDGLLDVVSLEEFTPGDIPAVVDELLQQPEFSGTFVKRNQVKTLEWISDSVMPVNLDGEPLTSKHIKFSVLPNAIKLVLPAHCPVVTNLD